MDTTIDLEDYLEHFSGTMHHYRYSPIFPNVLLTDGTKFLAEHAGAFWLMDMIASHIPSLPNDEYFAIALFSKGQKSRFVLCQDLDGDKILGEYAKQEVTYTDFPLSQIKLYVQRDPKGWVILLPSEY